MSKQIIERKKEFYDHLKNTLIILSIARDSGMQEAEVKNLDDLFQVVGEWKREAVEDNDEDSANLFLGMQSLVSALRAELNMLLLLKQDEPDAAWDSLIEAQSATIDAMRAHKDFSHLDSYAERLDAAEEFLFPPQVYLSAGMIVGREICTICSSDYEDCPHVVGMPYWGEFCCRRLEDVTPDHVAIVDDPANKRCRVTHFDVEGGRRNRMTWLIEPLEREGLDEGEQDKRIISGTILEANDLIS